MGMKAKVPVQYAWVGRVVSLPPPPCSVGLIYFTSPFAIAKRLEMRLSVSPATPISDASLPNHTKMFELVHVVTSMEDFESYLREHLSALLDLRRLHPGLDHQRLVEALVKVGVDIVLPHLGRRRQPEAEQGRLR
jgi:hypothetical protein